MKDDEGVLYINLTKDPITTVFFKNADELTASSLRLHAGTVYLTSIADVRLPFPQMEIVDTTFGANARAKAEKAAEKEAKAAARLAAKAEKEKAKSAGPAPLARSAAPEPGQSWPRRPLCAWRQLQPQPAASAARLWRRASAASNSFRFCSAFFASAATKCRWKNN